jgi:sugar phosphate isomerase/epimerase
MEDMTFRSVYYYESQEVAMKLSVTMISYEDQVRQGKMNVEEFIGIAAGLGIEGVDLLEYFWKDRDNEIKAVPLFLKKHQLTLSSFCIGNNFNRLGQEERRQQLDYVKQGLFTARELGASRLRIFGGAGPFPDGMARENVIRVVIDCIGEVIDLAEENDVTLVLENHGSIPVTSEDMLSIVKAIDSPYLKLNFDIGNFLDAGSEDPLVAARKLYPYVDHIHVKDLIRSENGKGSYEACITGQGMIPLDTILSFFEQMGYTGFVSLEYEAWDKCESISGVKQSITYLKRILQC